MLEFAGRHMISVSRSASGTRGAHHVISERSIWGWVRMRWSAFETVAARMLARDGVEVIWQLHLRAAASYGRGNWLSALALVGIADTAERLWRGDE
jgi:hypothetical protein